MTKPQVTPPGVIEPEELLGPAEAEEIWASLPASRRHAWFETPPGWSDEDWRATVTAGLDEAGQLRDELRDRRARPWRYEPAKSDPTLRRILDKLDDMNRRGGGHPMQVSLAYEARIDRRQIQRTLKKHGIPWMVIRDYKHR